MFFFVLPKNFIIIIIIIIMYSIIWKYAVAVEHDIHAFSSNLASFSSVIIEEILYLAFTNERIYSNVQKEVCDYYQHSQEVCGC